MESNFGKNAQIKIPLKKEFLIKLANAVLTTIQSTTTKPKVLINFVEQTKNLIEYLQSKDVLVQVVKNLNKGIFSYITKFDMCDLGLFFSKSKSKDVLNLTIFSGNGYFLSEHIKFFFEKILNSDFLIENDVILKSNFKFDNKSLSFYCEQKQKIVKRIKPVFVLCKNKLIKKTLKLILKNNVHFISSKNNSVKNFYELNFKAKSINIFKNKVQIVNEQIEKQIEKTYFTKIFKKTDLSDEDFILTALKNGAIVGKLNEKLIFFDTSFDFDLTDLFCHFLNLNLIWK